jgi:hypothetical protein
MNKNVFIFETTPATPHIETGLELAWRHSLQGDKIHYVPLFQNLNYIDWFTPAPEPEGTRHRGWLEFCNAKLPTSTLITSTTKASNLSIYKDRINLQAKEYFVKGVNLLPAALSSLSIRLKSGIGKTLDLDDLIPHIQDAEYVLNVFESVLFTYKVDLVYIFNGRTASTYPVFALAKQFDVELFIHERGASLTKFQLYSDLPQKYSTMQYEIFKSVRTVSPIFIKLGADRWFREQKSSRPRGWMPFLPEPTHRDGIPRHLMGKNFNVYFSSSNDEFDQIPGQSPNSGLGTQDEALSKLVEIHTQEEKDLVIRIHPNSRFKSKQDSDFAQQYTNLKYCHVVPAESNVDSYLLLTMANSVYHYGSTIGIESSYWGKPTLALANSCGAPWLATAANFEQLRSFVLQPTIKDSAMEFCLAYGFYNSTHGIDYEFYIPSGVSSGQLNVLSDRPT